MKDQLLLHVKRVVSKLNRSEKVNGLTASLLNCVCSSLIVKQVKLVHKQDLVLDPRFPCPPPFPFLISGRAFLSSMPDTSFHL